MIAGRRDNRKYHFSTFRQYTSNSCRHNIYWTSGRPLWNLWFTWRTSDRKYDNRPSFGFRFIHFSKYPLTSSTDHWFAPTCYIIKLYSNNHYSIFLANMFFLLLTFVYLNKIQILNTLRESRMYCLLLN